jgi:phosphoglycerate transport regulatory protein PgtC
MRREIERGYQEYLAENGAESAQIRWLDVGGTSEILKFIKTEFQSKPGGIDVDLLFGGGTDPFEELKKAKLLEPAEIDVGEMPASLNGVPLYDPDHTWYATMLAGFGILYNKEVLRRLNLPEPKTWSDAAIPRGLPLVAIGDPRRSGSLHVVYEIILQGYGWDKGWELLYRIAQNTRSFSSASTQTIRDVMVGEVAYAFAIDAYAGQAIRELGDQNIGYVIPEDHAVFTGDSIAILKGSKNYEQDKNFIRFLLSERGQLLLGGKKGAVGGPKEYELGKMPVLPSLYQKYKSDLSVWTDPFNYNRSALAYNSKLSSERWQLVNDIFGTFLIENLLPPSVKKDDLPLLLKNWKNLAFRRSVIDSWSAQKKEGRWMIIAPAVCVFFLVLVLSLLKFRKSRLADSYRTIFSPVQ